MTAKNESLPELIPCPFCGGRPLADVDSLDPNWVYCTDCGVGYHFGTIEQAIEAWNRRSQPSTDLGLIARSVRDRIRPLLDRRGDEAIDICAITLRLIHDELQRHLNTPTEDRS